MVWVNISGYFHRQKTQKGWLIESLPLRRFLFTKRTLFRSPYLDLPIFTTRSKAQSDEIFLEEHARSVRSLNSTMPRGLFSNIDPEAANYHSLYVSLLKTYYNSWK